MKTLFFLLLPAALFLSGCQTTHQFTEPSAHWITRHGQLRYSHGVQSVIGSATVSYVPVHHFQLDFSAGPGFPLLKLREDRTFASAEGSLARRGWQGRPEEAPQPLKSWFGLHEVFNKLAATPKNPRPTKLQSLTPGFWEAEVTPENGEPARVQIRFPGTGETFLFVLQPAA